MPSYHPNCQLRWCRNQKTGRVGPGTQYLVDGQQTVLVCGSCATKWAIKRGLQPDPKARPKARKQRPVA
jgi:hypothetical protein